MAEGLAESAINSIMRLACTVMAGSVLGGGASGSRPHLLVKMHAMLHSSSCSGRPLILAYMMVNVKMLHDSALSDAEHHDGLPQCGKEREG